MITSFNINKKQISFNFSILLVLIALFVFVSMPFQVYHFRQ